MSTERQLLVGYSLERTMNQIRAFLSTTLHMSVFAIVACGGERRPAGDAGAAPLKVAPSTSRAVTRQRGVAEPAPPCRRVSDGHLKICPSHPRADLRSVLERRRVSGIAANP